MKRVFKVLSIIITVIFIVFVLIPLALERFCATEQWKTIFAEYHVSDQDGKTHHGYFSLGRILILDLQNLQYGYEIAGKGVVAPRSVEMDEKQELDWNAWEMDWSPWRRTVGRGPFKPDYGIDGFKWADKGFIWAGPTYLARGRRIFSEGTRYGYSIPMNTLSEVVLPGAPLDVKAENLDILGRFPEYRVRYEDDYFKFDYVYRAQSNRWYHWNGGAPFQVGDFGLGTMTEMPCTIEGTIIHKKDTKVFQVKGVGVMEDAAGLPWSWFDWGNHNWAAVSFPNAWSLGIWKAEDDWQWGYHRKPEEAWIWDPEQGDFHHATRVELLDAEVVEEELNKMQYLRKYHWRAYTNEGVLELTGRQISFNPLKRGVPYTPFTFKESYGIGVYEGRFVRPNGKTVELKGGYGTPEHFTALFPDMFWLCPILLLALILSWGGTSIAGRVERAESYRTPIIIIALMILAVLCLWWYWS